MHSESLHKNHAVRHASVGACPSEASLSPRLAHSSLALLRQGALRLEVEDNKEGDGHEHAHDVRP
eukprot:CAMPEP_0195095500 /NCGR_PEP_ID=MMETSP0448-20130528/46925_1 /TAXON_ID=66468 /ORGANISM="Heterocapsa triquestra, Strain CCMP 448" /LENGTH=64 /DNA_ID=CAMNT_0040129721 /DNA_START=34 /DNA_END=225 /DNA_ORIENTATION=+